MSFVNEEDIMIDDILFNEQQQKLRKLVRLLDGQVLEMTYQMTYR
jgi:predicted AAA+ superfamily ATPase